MQNLEEIDPEQAKAIREKEEEKAAEERLRLRHQGDKKWARDMRRFQGRMDRKENRDDYHNMIREKQRLKDRQRSVRRDQADDSDDSEQESGYDSEDEEQVSDSQLKQEAIDRIRKQMNDSDEGDEHASGSE